MGAEGAWPDPHFHPGPLWSLGYSYPWPILHSPRAPLLHRHTNALSDMLTTRTHAHTYAPSVVSIQQAETWHRESRQRQQLCNGLHVGRSFGQAVGGGGVSIVRGWRVVCGHLSSVSVFCPSSLVALHEGSHLPTASHLRLRERLWHFALWACPSPTHLFPCTQDVTTLRSTADQLWLFHFSAASTLLFPSIVI